MQQKKQKNKKSPATNNLAILGQATKLTLGEPGRILEGRFPNFRPMER